jgi:hypothetical protein
VAEKSLDGYAAEQRLELSNADSGKKLSESSMEVVQLLHPNS